MVKGNKKNRFLKNKLQLNTFINNIQDITNYKIKVNLIVENRKYYKSYEIELDLRKLGIDNTKSCKYKLSRDLGIIVSRYYYKNGKLPTVKKIKNEIYNRENLIIKDESEVIV